MSYWRYPVLDALPALFLGLIVATRQVVGMVYTFVVFLDRRQRTRMGVQYPVAHQLVKIRDRPRLRIHLRVLERKNDLQCVMIYPLPALCLVHGLAEWKTLPGQKLLAVVTA